MRLGNQSYLKMTALAALGLVLAIAVFRDRQQTDKTTTEAIPRPSPFETVKEQVKHAGNETAEKQFMTYAETRMTILNASNVKTRLLADDVSCSFHYFDETEYAKQARTYKNEVVTLKNKNLSTEKSLTFVFASAGKCVEEINCNIRLSKNAPNSITFDKKLIERIPKHGCVAEAQMKWTAVLAETIDEADAVPVDEQETRDWVERAVTADFSKTLQAAKMSPVIEDGVAKGILFDAIQHDSIYEKIGLQNGDVVTHVDDNEVATDVSQLLDPKQTDQNKKITIERNGETIDLLY